MSCVDKVLEAVGGKLQRKTIENIEKRISKIEGLSSDEMAKLIVKEARETVRQAHVKKRNTMLAMQAEYKLTQFVLNTHGEDPVKGFEAILGGIQSYKAGSRASVFARQKALEGQWFSGLMRDLKKEELFDDFADGALDKQIMDELYNIDEPRENSKARRIAKIVDEHQNYWRTQANKAGADISKLDKRIMMQTHDMYKIMRLGAQAYKDLLFESLDLEGTFGAKFKNLNNPDAKISDATRKSLMKELDDKLQRLYDNLSTGEHGRIAHIYDDELGKFVKSPPALADFKRKGSTSGAMSRSRLLHFKDSDSFYNYNIRAGRGNLRETLVDTIAGMSSKTGLMETLGPAPHDVFHRAWETVRKAKLGDDVALQGMAKGRGRVDNLMMIVDGTSSVPGNAMLARMGMVSRWVQVTSKLGGMVISAIADIPVGASELQSQGKGFLSSYKDTILGVANDLTGKEKQSFASMFGIYSDQMAYDLGARYSAEESFTGFMSKSSATFFKMTGMDWWNTRNRTNLSISMSNWLAENADTKFDSLNQYLRETLEGHNITAKDWDILSRSVEQTDSGYKLMTPEALDRLDDSVFADVKNVEAYKEELRKKLIGYYIDRTSYAVLEPDARTMALMRQGSRPGTAPGELYRAIMTFKTFPIGMVQKVWGREMYAHNTAMSSRFASLANLMVMTTAFGYMSMSAKDMLRGKEPRDVNDPKTWAAAMMQGGAIGIYGDFLLGQSNRFGGGTLQTLAGPTLGTIADVGDLITKIRDGDDPTNKAFNILKSNTPFANLFYTRMALDYLIYYRIQEAISPGYLRRLERRMEKESGHKYMEALKPSSIIPYGGF